jgi:hypothetical protein
LTACSFMSNTAVRCEYSFDCVVKELTSLILSLFCVSISGCAETLDVVQISCLMLQILTAFFLSFFRVSISVCA